MKLFDEVSVDNTRFAGYQVRAGPGLRQADRRFGKAAADKICMIVKPGFDGIFHFVGLIASVLSESFKI